MKAQAASLHDAVRGYGEGRCLLERKGLQGAVARCGDLASASICEAVALDHVIDGTQTELEALCRPAPVAAAGL